MDVFEHIESAGRTEYDHAVWWNGYGAYSMGISHESAQNNLDDGNFHTFGLAWTPGSLTFYIDGAKTWHLSAGDVAISNIPEYIILDTELTSASGVPSGGYGPLGSSSNPYMEVDYVRVYPYSTNTTSTTLTLLQMHMFRVGSPQQPISLAHQHYLSKRMQPAIARFLTLSLISLKSPGRCYRQRSTSPLRPLARIRL